MQYFFVLVLSTAMALCSLQTVSAQDLSPRAYIITPLHSNAITLTWSFYDGSINYNGALPISGATGKYNVPMFSYYHAFSVFGHSANIVASLPYGFGNFQGTTSGAEQHIHRSGLLDSVYRFSLNLKGGPAMPPPQFPCRRRSFFNGSRRSCWAPVSECRLRPASTTRPC